MADDKHIIKFWRGTRAKYNSIEKDFWTRYSIIEPDGTITEVFGDDNSTDHKRILSEATGELMPVIECYSGFTSITALTVTGFAIGDRYMVGNDATSLLTADDDSALYNIYTIGNDCTNASDIDTDKCQIQPFTNRVSVRIIKRGNKKYVLVDGVLTTYDDIDCGSWDDPSKTIATGE